MSYTPAKDISRWQGNWQDTGEPIVLVKMSGGDAGLYMDSNASKNYEGAIAAGRAVGGYHFIGWVAGAEQEAEYFLRAMQPLAEGDVYALDIEAIPAGTDPVAYTRDMVTYIHDHISVWPLVYMNLNTLNSYDWSTVLNNCGLWLADWAVSPDATIPTHYTYVMQQYSDGPAYDHDAWFGTVDQFKKYGYHAPQPTTAPEVPVEPVAAPDPVVTQPEPTPVVETPVTVVSEPVTTVTTPAEPTVTVPAASVEPTVATTKKNALVAFFIWLVSLFKRK